MEWDFTHASYRQTICRCISIFRCIRKLGVWAYSGSQWFQLPWTGKVVEQQIAVKELIPVVVAAVVWDKQWKGLDVKCHSDNQAVVAVMQTRTSRDPNIKHLLRCLSFIEAQWFCGGQG